MLYKQGTQRIEVIVRREGSGGSVSKGAKEKDPNAPPIDEEESERVEYRKALTGFTGQKVAALTKQVLREAVNYYVSGQGLYNGDQALQQQIDRQMEILQDGIGLAQNVAMGAASGAFLGVPGMIVGGLAGAATSAISIGARTAHRRREYNYEVFRENNAIEYSRARAMINLTTGRLR